MENNSTSQLDEAPLSLDALAERATQEMQTYLAAQVEAQARWQQALDAPFQSLRAYPSPTEAQLREAFQAYEATWAEVAKEVERAGRRMLPPQAVLDLADGAPLDTFFDEAPFGPPWGDRIKVHVPVAKYIFLPSNFRPAGSRDVFTLSLTTRNPVNAPFDGGVNASKENGTLFFNNVLTSTSGPATMSISACLGAMVIPQNERGRLRIRTHVAYGGTGLMTLPPGANRPAYVRAENIFSLRMTCISRSLSGSAQRIEQDITAFELNQGWTGAGGRPLGASDYFNSRRHGTELLIPFDRAGGPPRIYEAWVCGQDLAICGADVGAGAFSAISISMNCYVPLITVEELVESVKYW